MTSVAIVLAAGESKRLGQPKQLLTHEGETLIQRAVRKSHEVGVARVLVVTGAHSEVVSAELADVDCVMVHNANWQRGMGDSIACGARAVSSTMPDCSAVLLLLCDQPFVPVSHLTSLLERSELDSCITATDYTDETHGPPACFPARYVDALSGLSGTTGAKSLIKKEAVALISCKEAATDIDVTKDLRHLH